MTYCTDGPFRLRRSSLLCILVAQSVSPTVTNQAQCHHAESEAMSGSSLWLVPPEKSELYSVIHDLILNQLPSIFPIASVPGFTPHVTLTADTVFPNLEDSQQWLDSLDLPQSMEVLKVVIGEAEVGSTFFRKLAMRCEKTQGLCELAIHARKAAMGESRIQSAKRWVEEDYKPHISLMYSDLPIPILQGQLEDVHVKITKVKQRSPNSDTAKGGAIWLVPTYKPIEGWKPEAIRELPKTEWSWEI